LANDVILVGLLTDTSINQKNHLFAKGGGIGGGRMGLVAHPCVLWGTCPPLLNFDVCSNRFKQHN